MTGAERVLEQILRCFPGADVFTAIDYLPATHRHVLRGSRVITSFIQRLPRARTAYWNYIPLMPLAFERFDLSEYDLVISNSHTVAKGVRTHPEQAHVCYLETPMRFAWDLEEYYLEQFRMRGWRRALARAVFNRLRKWDAATASRVDAFVAVSRFVAGRSLRYYGREATVVYPPVDVRFFTPGDAARSDFYLAASRLTPFKRLGLIVEAFRSMPDRKLVVIGDGPERARLEATRPRNVELLGYQPDEVLRDHMRRARAFLFAAPEDFGIVMAEAQACGTPVIALAHGGAVEIVRDLDAQHPTGVLFDAPTPAAVGQAVRQFEARASDIATSACRENAERFAPELFRDRFMACVAAVLERRSAASR